MEDKNRQPNLDKYLNIDEAMAPLYSIIMQMNELDGFLLDDQFGTSMQLAEVSIDMPVQLEVFIDEYGEVIIGSSPPLYYTETSVMPVFHQLRLKIKTEEETKR